MKGGMADLGMKSPIFLPGPVEPHYGANRYLTFEGFSVDEHGKQHYLDATVAYRQACLRTIEYLRRFGITSPFPGQLVSDPDRLQRLSGILAAQLRTHTRTCRGSG